MFAGLVLAPDGSGTKLTAMVVCHLGDPEAAQRELAPFTGFGSPLVVQVGPMPYPVMNRLLDDGFPNGSLNYWLSSFTDGMSDALVDVAVDRFARVPSPMSRMLFEHFHGAVTRIARPRPPSRTASPAGTFCCRRCGWTARREVNIAWTRRRTRRSPSCPIAAGQLPR